MTQIVSENARAQKSGKVGAMVCGFINQLPKPLDPAYVVSLLRKNKFPLLALNEADLPSALVDSPEFEQALQDDRDWFAVQYDEYLRIREEWLKRDIAGMFIKTACIAPSFPYMSDNLDILVPESRGEEAREVVRRTGHVELRNIEEPKKYLFRKFKGGRSVSAIHVHHWAGWNVNFFEEDLLWERSRVSPDDPTVIAPSPEDALLINLAHAFYENKRFDLHDLEKMRVNWNRHDLDWDYLPKVPCRRGWHDGFLLGMLLAAHLETKLTGESAVPERYLQQWEAELQRYPRAYKYWRGLLERPVEMPFEVSFVFSKILYYQKITRDVHDSIPRRVRNTYETLAWGFRLKTGIRPQRSMLVSISGLDGSGKSAQAQALTDIFELTEIKGSYYWNRVGCSPFTRTLSRINALFSRGDAPGTSADTPRERGDLGSRNGAIQAVWTWANVIDLAVRYTFRVRLPLLKGMFGFGKVIVADRYVLDAEAEIRSRLARPGIATRLALAFLRSVSPRPHLAYLLDVPVEVAQERHELPVTEGTLTEYRAQFMALAPNINAHIVDGTRSITEIGDGITAEVLKYWSDRYETWLNALLLSNPGQRNPKRS